MKDLKKIIIIILVLILILTIIIAFLFKKYENKPHEDFSSPYGDEKVIQKEVSRVSRNIDYYSVELIVNNYLNAIISQDNDDLYNTLNPESITKLNINKENVVSKLNNIIDGEENNIDDYKFIIDDMYFSESEGDIITYFVYLKILNIVNEKTIETSLMVETDTKNDAYYIIPFEYMKEKGYLEIKEGIEYETSIENIENNTYNEIEYQNLDDYTILLNLMTNFTDKLVYDLDDSYNLFSDEYKKSRFATFEEYKIYIKNNIRDILASSIKKYKINEDDNYTEYICLDQYGNYYIFKETAVMQYTVQLDTYTIDSEEFLNKYNNGTDQLKVGMNLEKVFQALNRKDYEYIYEKLNKEFKINNFRTLEDFAEYMQENLFSINKASYGKFESKSGSYIYEVKITDATENDENIIEKNFIVKLGEGTDFEISFNK